MKISFITQQTGLPQAAVHQTIQLLEEGATIPFIARYRKDRVGGIDEVAIMAIADALQDFNQLEDRRQSILKSLADLEVTDAVLLEKIHNCTLLAELEDLYLPYKPKRKTRATLARELGLEPLAKMLMAQRLADPIYAAQNFVSSQVPEPEDALNGACDILAEWMQEHPYARKQLRKIFEREAIISSKVVKAKMEAAATYQQYFDFQEPLKRCPSHRFLALMRGKEAGLLQVKISVDGDKALDLLHQIFIKGKTACTPYLELATKEAWKRLLEPALETEFRNAAKIKSDLAAIEVFAQNLKQLLLAPPLGQMRVLGIDPGFQSGCKCVCLDAQGQLLHNETVYPFKSKDDANRAANKISQLVATYKIDAIAIGNGTAGRETADFIERIRFQSDVKAFVVNEDGASIYSASAVARKEFPNYDVTVRGAVSIGRRLMDPLSELVKIEPKSIGVGQYQHDVNQNLLQEKLDRVVMHAVNAVGVNVNTASEHLLTYVSGLGPSLAAKIVAHRDSSGPFQQRTDLLSVKGLGAKAFQQSAGFLRIPDSINPLDNSAVHPEHYTIAAKMARDLKLQVADLIGNPQTIAQITVEPYLTEDFGKLAFNDLLDELRRPGRDPRKAVQAFRFAEGIREIKDLHVGMVLPGLISNITNFGAFVDIGLKEKGLVHISQLSNTYVSDPLQVVKLQQQVRVKVLEIDVPRKRIALSMKDVSDQ